MKESRLFRILYYLLQHKKATAPELAEEFEVSVRTIYRDIDYISSAGVPIYATQGKDGGIAILDSFTLDKSMLTEIEKEQILTALEALIATDGKTTDELLIKLKTLFQMQTTNWIEVDFSDWFQEKPAQNIFNDIKKAILDRYVISFEYFNHQGNHVFRHIQPLKLLFKGKAWYVYGFCLLRNEYRFFKLWSYVKKKYKLNVTNFLCSERSLTCYFYCILLDVFKILFLIFIWRQISTMTVNAHGIVKCFDVFKNQFMCMCIIKDFKPVDPFSLQKCMERFYTGVIPWICFL